MEHDLTVDLAVDLDEQGSATYIAKVELGEIKVEGRAFTPSQALDKGIMQAVAEYVSYQAGDHK